MTLLNDIEAAKIIGLKVQTLRNYRFHGKGPAYVKMGRSIRYLEEDLKQYILENRIVPEVAERRTHILRKRGEGCER